MGRPTGVVVLGANKSRLEPEPRGCSLSAWFSRQRLAPELGYLPGSDTWAMRLITKWDGVRDLINELLKC